MELTARLIALAATAFAITISAAPADFDTDPVDPEKLVAFMEKWKTYKPLNIPTDPAEVKLIVPALLKDPGGPWWGYLSFLMAGPHFELRMAKDRKGFATNIVASLRRIDVAISKAMATNNDPAFTQIRKNL